MSKIEVNAIEPQCGTTLTVGASGDTITFPTGTTIVNNGSQTGFGRTGTVDWQTTPKTATFTAVSGEGYFCNTTAGVITVNLPAGSAGAIVSLADYAGTWQTNNVTVTPNGSEKIGGIDGDVFLNTEGQSVTFVYVDSTQGWINTMDSTSNERGSVFICASVSGACNAIVTSGDFKTAIFKGPGTFTVNSGSGPLSVVDYTVVAGGGGGGGGRNCASQGHGAGAGSGGFRLSNSYNLPAPTTSPLANPTGIIVTTTAYPITVGGGGTGGIPSAAANEGSIGNNSIFSTITSTGGGGGKSMGNLSATPISANGNPGGSGGGGANGGASGGTAGAGNTPPVSPPQGQPGGGGAPNGRSSGGGGAGASGGAYSPSTPNPGYGGDGSYLADTFFGPTAPSYGTPGPVGSTRYFAGGGAGSEFSPQGYPAGSGGAGGGADGASGGPGTSAGNAGATNTGGGASPAQGGYTSSGASGGSGIVMIRYKFQ